MSDSETTRQVDQFIGGDSRDDLSKLSELARQAFEQQRTTDCLDLTRAILLADPENAEAQALRTSMRTALHQDLEKARALFRTTDDSVLPPSLPIYPRLPAAASTVAGIAVKTTRQAPEQPPAEPVPQPEERIEDVPLFRETLAQRRARSEQKWRPRFLDVAAALVVIALGIAAIPMYRSLSNPVTPAAAESFSVAPADIAPVSGGLELAYAEPEENLSTFEAGQETVVAAPAESMASLPVNLVASQPADGRPVAVTAPDPLSTAIRTDASLPTANASSQTGTLAVSAQVSTDIYMDGRHLGSAPISIQLPAGAHTLEYRHGSLRKSVVHVIVPGQTTKAAITFYVSVAINASPWADVFIDGVERKLLGQTPLSTLQLPVGGVLIFEHPGFPAKKHQITGTEAPIQIVFP